MCFDCTLAHLLKMALKGPKLSGVAFDEIMDVFKEKSRRTDQ